MTRQELNALALEVYCSDRWASMLAADLTFVGRKTAPATVNHWQSGERAVPEWVPDALVLAFFQRSQRLRNASHTAARVANRLASSLIEEPEPDQDLAPRM